MCKNQEEKRERLEKAFEEIMANDFPDFYKKNKLTNRRSLSRICTMKSTPQYINITRLKPVIKIKS